jgi:pimeloyl-ACP methyl ester carboxylesterase
MNRTTYLFLVLAETLFYPLDMKADYATASDSLMDIELNGLQQKILIQSKDISNPILLWLHGGPGASEMFINHYCMDSLTNFYTVVHWDQRGTSLSYHEGMQCSDVSFDKIVDDAIRLTSILKEKYHQEKIFLVGHSFGTVLGIHIIEKHPEDYYAYVGIGQVVHEEKSKEITYNWLVNKLREDGDMVELERIRDDHSLPRSLIDRYKGIYYKEKTLFDVIRTSPYYDEGYLDTYLESMKFVRESVSKGPATYEKDIYHEIVEFQIPVYFFEGRHDRIAACAPEMVVEYLGKISASKKEIIWFEESAHHPNIDEPDKFQKILVDKILMERFPDPRFNE